MRSLFQASRPPLTTRFTTWYERLTFTAKLRLFPRLTGAALGAVLLVTVGFGLLAERRLERLGNEYYPVVESNWRLEQTLGVIQRGFQDAVAADDVDELALTDSLARLFIDAVHADARGERANDYALRERFEAYYSQGRAVSARMILGEHGDDLRRAQGELTARHRVLKAALAAAARRDRAAMAQAIAEERTRQRYAWVVCVVLTFVFVLAVVVLSRAAAESLTVPLREAVRVADRVADGDLTMMLPAPHDDEVGQLLRSMERMVANLRASEDRLVHQATHDALTGLANRSLFRERVNHVAQRSRQGRSVVVMYIDLDNFKDVNDGLGHDAGDQLLTTVADRLLTATRGSDTVARLGGDEFAILLRDVRDESDVIIVAERVARSLGQPLGIAGTEVRVGGSIGITFGHQGASADDLLRQADVAMYAAKHGGKGRYVIFEESMHKAALERLVLESDLRTALELGQLELHYQPVVHLATRRIIGAEALIRWRHPERGLVGPGEFIPLAESSGLILPIGRWVVDEACRQNAEWQRLLAQRAQLASSRSDVGHSDFKVAVNISAWQIQHREMVAEVRESLARWGLPPRMLTLEITESVMLRDTEATLARLRELKTLGLTLAVDDFGTGYSSLSYLQRFPIDVLKIDKTFIDAVGSVGANASLTRAIIALGDALGLAMVAEGVERPEQVESLRQLGCSLGQGYHFARPLPAAELTALLRSAGRKTPMALEPVPMAVGW